MKVTHFFLKEAKLLLSKANFYKMVSFIVSSNYKLQIRGVVCKKKKLLSVLDRIPLFSENQPIVFNELSCMLLN